VWGALHGAFLIGHRVWVATPVAAWLNARAGAVRWVWHAVAVCVTFHCVCLAWCFFRLTRFSESVACVRKWFDCDPGKMWAGPWLDPAVWLALALYLALVWAARRCATRRSTRRACVRAAAGGAAWGVRFGTLALAALLAPTGAKATFIYFQF
jgi:hypothetical protein